MVVLSLVVLGCVVLCCSMVVLVCGVVSCVECVVLQAQLSLSVRVL